MAATIHTINNAFIQAMQNEGTHHALSRDQKVGGLEVTVTEIEAVAVRKMSAQQRAGGDIPGFDGVKILDGHRAIKAQQQLVLFVETHITTAQELF